MLLLNKSYLAYQVGAQQFRHRYSTVLFAFALAYDEYFRVVASAEMLTGLYFSSLSKDVKALREIYKRTYISFLESEKLGEYMENANQYCEEIEVVFKRLYSELPKIMNETMH